jgi:hypothetical protein
MEMATTRQLTGDLPAISLALRPWAGPNLATPKAAESKKRFGLFALPDSVEHGYLFVK